MENEYLRSSAGNLTVGMSYKIMLLLGQDWMLNFTARVVFRGSKKWKNGREIRVRMRVRGKWRKCRREGEVEERRNLHM